MLKLRVFTPGQRHSVKADFSALTKGYVPTKGLLKACKSTGGRNNTGKMTMRYRGGGHKQRIRKIDFCRLKDGVEAVVRTIEYDPKRTAFIALVVYKDGEKRYILCPEGLKVGDKVMSGKKAAPELGCCLLLRDMPSGTIVHNIELNPGGGGKLVRSAGGSAQVMAKDKNHVSIKLSSGQVRLVRGDCRATVGALSNANHKNVRLGKAGKNIWCGVRPRVRGVAMNPVDHPMGGGEGKASGGLARSRKGKYAKGLNTRPVSKYSDKLLQSCLGR
ncbi:MAG: 50S ribosomal protein L2 [Cytophagales bacterium]|nr:50S ribosomal protein L2 [Cytophagales bacterium]